MDHPRLLLKMARGLEPADIVLKGGTIVNVLTGTMEQADLAMAGGLIVGVGRYSGRQEVDVTGSWLTPGFIDPHLHLESTMVLPAELARVIVPQGATTVVADPHEIGNVLGLPGIRFLIEASRGLDLDVWFMAPSAVPATHLETAGARLSADDLAELLAEPEVLGLAEMMNVPGVILGDDDVWAKIDRFPNRPIDGHAPLVSGPDLSAYLLAGIGTDHESTDPDEAWEKARRGLRVFIREGSQARNLDALLPLVTPTSARRFAFCTDDRHPGDLITEGHIDHILRQAVTRGLDPVLAITLATLNAAEAYGLKRTGALAPGFKADVVVLPDLVTFRPSRVYKDGRLAAVAGEPVRVPEPATIPDWTRVMNRAPFRADDLQCAATGAKVRVIDLVPGQLLTGHSEENAPVRNGFLTADPGRDLARLVVAERHTGTGRVSHGLVRGFGLNRGALASSVAHDSHNLVAVGVDDDDLVTALEEVRRMGGGLAAAAGGRILARLPLPVAGLISAGTAAQAARDHEKLDHAAQTLGCRMASPFMALSFLALPVIPHLRLTDRGLVDVDRFDFVPLFL